MADPEIGDADADASQTRAARAVRASRANARAAAAASTAGPSRTVRIRPDNDLLEDGEDDGDFESADEAPAAVPASSNGARPRPISRPADDPDRTGALPAATAATAVVKRPAGPPPSAPPGAAPRPAPAAPAASTSTPPEEKKQRRSTTAIVKDVLDKVGLVVQLVALVFFLVLVIHILFVSSDANASNSIVKHFSDWASDLVGDFRNIFTARTEKGRVFENYGTAAAVYLIVGAVVRRVLRK